MQRKTGGLVVAVLVIAGAGIGWYAMRPDNVRVAGKNSEPSTRPSVASGTAPATTRATNGAASMPPVTYLDAIRVTNPAVKQTELLSVPLDLTEAAHLFLTESVYVCGRGDLWITRNDAPETSAVLAKSYDEQTHLTREPVEFVWWRDDGEGNWAAWLACRTVDGYEWVTPKSRLKMPTDQTLDWSRAVFVDDDALAVPTSRGVAVVRATPKPSVEPVDLLPPGKISDALNAPQMLVDGQGVLAWVPTATDGPRGTHVARYIDGKWQTLDEKDWPTSIVHLVPLVDGSVLRLIGDGPKIRMSLVTLSAGAVDEAAIEKLVEQLSEADPRDRLTAYKELTRYGPGMWPILERLRDEQPPEAQLRMGQLLSNRIAPTLGGMKPVNDTLRVVGRDGTGGVVFYGDAGVSTTDADGKTQLVNPAWVSIRAGRTPELLPTAMTTDLRPDRHTINYYNNFWVVTDSVNGPRRLIGQKLQGLLAADERAYDQLVGIDSRGRWVFRRSGQSPTTTTPPSRGDVLILDPTLADPTPKLPGWTIPNTKESGWTLDGWPAVNVNDKYWRLKEKAWERLDPKKDKLIDALPAPTTTPSSILTTRDGTRYFDGIVTLQRQPKDKAAHTYEFPIDARGVGPAYLTETADKTLFLMNAPGRIVRLTGIDKPEQKLTVDGVFTRKIPSGTIRRFWIDPAGRLCIAHDQAEMTVLFPTGVITPEIRKMMPTDELPDEK